MRKLWTFDEGRAGFLFRDDVFEFTNAPSYASGSVKKGALTMRLGGRDDEKVAGLSGGWTKAFELDEAMSVTLSFKVKLVQGGGYRAKDFADVRVHLDGSPVEVDGRPFALRLKGANGDEQRKTGWVKIEIDLGPLAAGSHDITIGGFSNRKVGKDAFTKYTFDDVRLDGVRPKPAKLDPFERDVLKLVNEEREERGLDPLKADRNLTDAAEDWSRKMGDGDFFRHSDTNRQAKKHGYDPAGLGENIAAGQATPKEVVAAWLASPGHRGNILNGDYEHIGIGYYRKKNDGGDAPYVHYWTQIFGAPAEDYVF